MLTEAELDPYFDVIRREAFRLESLPAYAVSSESAGLGAYLSGAPFEVSRAGQAFKAFIRSQVEAGIRWHRVRVVRGAADRLRALGVRVGLHGQRGPGLSHLRP